MYIYIYEYIYIYIYMSTVNDQSYADEHCFARKDAVFKSANFTAELSEGDRISSVPLDFVNCVVCTVTSCGAKVREKEDSK
jgi:hypothetical protein